MDVLITAERIHERVAELGRQISLDYADRPLTIVGVLTGSLIFLADLVRHVKLPLRIGLIQSSSYRGASTAPGELIIQADWTPNIAGRHLLLLDDILDTGRTLGRLVADFRDRDLASLRVAVLLRKVGRQVVPIVPDYCGFDIPDKFVVGYGLDFNDEFRHLPDIGVLPVMHEASSR